MTIKDRPKVLAWDVHCGIRELSMTAINIASKLSLVSEHWSPKIVASFNGHDVMVVKLKGEFVWHSHADTDDFFYVVKGNLTLRLRDGDVLLGPGDLYVVPKGVEHCPVADQEVHLVLIEPKSTLNTGNITNERTVAQLESI